MARQDKTGESYEKTLSVSLEKLGYVCNSESGKNYIRPLKTDKEICISETYIQPDIVVRYGLDIQAIIYVTHWSKARNSAFKFWRTWEELAQQRNALGDSFLSINCVFEALPEELEPQMFLSSDELDRDPSRDSKVPIKFHGWYPGTTWAMLESFDLSLVFPLAYEAVYLKRSISNPHDVKTTNLLANALLHGSKFYLRKQWEILQQVSKRYQTGLEKLTLTKSRYRIGLLHVYIAYRLWGKSIGSIDLLSFINLLILLDPKILAVHEQSIEDLIGSDENDKIKDFFSLLSKVPVRVGKKPKFLLEIKMNDTEQGFCLRLNSDLRDCLRDLKSHTSEVGFLDVVLKSFSRFDEVIDNSGEAFTDISNLDLVREKEAFVRSKFLNVLGDSNQLIELFQDFSKLSNSERKEISSHEQNWIFEMVIYLAGIDIAEDIYTKIGAIFEENDHSLRLHAPFADETVVVLYFLLGRDICVHWAKKESKRTLTKDEFYALSWQALGESIATSFLAKKVPARTQDEVCARYINNKIMRILGSNANGFYMMVEHYLSDICFLNFTEDVQNHKKELQKRICKAWQTDVVGKLWSGRPLETRMDGVSKNGKWLIKVQSSQDGNEGHKTKELAGRCRALRLAWSHGDDPRDRSQWTFSERPLPKLALVLDGDWDATKKRNLYEAGWDWIGDVSQLDQLRQLIQEG